MAKGKHRYAGVRPHRLTQREVVDRIERNGITREDLKFASEEGYERGKEEGVAIGMDMLYGAILITLHRLFGFGKKRLIRLVYEVTQTQIKELSNYEILEKLMKETGVSLPMLRDLTKEVV